jgi:hypothetical protein
MDRVGYLENYLCYQESNYGGVGLSRLCFLLQLLLLCGASIMI